MRTYAEIDLREDLQLLIGQEDFQAVQVILACTDAAYVSIRQHTSAYVSIRQAVQVVLACTDV
jgi:hypothetical protein